MGRLTTIDTTWARSAAQPAVDQFTPLADAGECRSDLAAVAEKLRALCSSALERGEFDEINRLVDASHAIQRALVALTGDDPFPAGGIGRPRVSW